MTTEGHIYCWGRNDESQCGAGDRFGAYEREQKLKQAEAHATEEAKEPPVATTTATEERPQEEVKTTKRKSKKESQPEEPDMDGIDYFLRPHRV